MKTFPAAFLSGIVIFSNTNQACETALTDSFLTLAHQDAAYTE